MATLTGVNATVAEASAFLRVPRKTIRTWISRYKIEKVGRTSTREYTYTLESLVEAEFRARTSVGGRPKTTLD